MKIISEGVEGMSFFANFDDGSKEKAMHVNPKKGLYIEEEAGMAMVTKCKVKNSDKKVIAEFGNRVDALCFVADAKAQV